MLIAPWLLLALGNGHDLGQQVSHDLAPGQGVTYWLPSSDGKTVFYAVTEEGFAGGQWFRASSDGSQDALALTDPLPLDRTVNRGQISSDGNWLAYTCDKDTVGQIEIYCVPTDGSRAVVKLNPSLAPTEDVNQYYFLFTPDASRVVFRVGFGVGAMYSARPDGSEPAALLTTAPFLFQITSDSQRVVFQHGPVYSVAADGSSPPVELSDANASEVYLSPDGRRVVFEAVTFPDPEFATHWIYSVRVDGSEEPILLFDPVQSDPTLSPEVQISADSRWVVQRTDVSPFPNELHGARIDGSAPAIRLSDPTTGGGGVHAGFRFTPDGRVVYRYSAVGVPTGIYVAPRDGSSPARRITPLAQYPTPMSVEVANGRVVFGGGVPESPSELLVELYSQAIDGSAPPVRLSPPMVAGGDFNYPTLKISADGEWALYLADQETDQLNELFAVPIDGRARARKLNRPLPAGGLSFAVTPDSKRVLYVAQQDELGTFEICTTELGDPLPFLGESSPLRPGRPIR